MHGLFHRSAFQPIEFSVLDVLGKLRSTLSLKVHLPYSCCRRAEEEERDGTEREERREKGDEVGREKRGEVGRETRERKS